MSTDTTVIDIKYLSLGHRRDGKTFTFSKKKVTTGYQIGILHKKVGFEQIKG